MNSLNLLSARVGIGARPRPKRSRSVGDAIRSSTTSSSDPPTNDLPPLKRSVSQHVSLRSETLDEKDRTLTEDDSKWSPVKTVEPDTESKLEADEATDEKTPLLEKDGSEPPEDYKSPKPPSVLYRIVTALSGSLRWVVSRLIAPGVYLVACFRQEDGTYSPLAPFRRSKRRKQNGRASTARALGLSGTLSSMSSEKRSRRSGAKVDDEDFSYPELDDSSGSLPDRADYESRAQSSSDDSMPTRRSIRIKLNSDEVQRKRKQRRTKDSGQNGNATQEELTAAELKSPTSPSSSSGLTKYPHAPKPPRPLIPRRLPSYTAYNPSQSSSLSKKTLVLDLDETLIHSLAKGGRMSSGHMVEVRLSAPSTYNGMTLGPQHPILYYVHKRPHCDDFLRRISQWYNLVVFTASVQEYADPVIDWLEQERKYFSARYYRQHCTFRNGAYIKDLSSIEPDLSKVMILDNSPLSYIFHESNAIPIEGWINDPTDNDLLHLIPLFEGLQYVTDVRALLALRRGEFEATH